MAEGRRLPRITAQGPGISRSTARRCKPRSTGVGIAMGIRPYIDDDLAAGRLVAPFAPSVPKGMRWYWSIVASASSSATAAFPRWIMRAVAKPSGRAAWRDALVETLQSCYLTPIGRLTGWSPCQQPQPPLLQPFFNEPISAKTDRGEVRTDSQRITWTTAGLGAGQGLGAN